MNQVVEQVWDEVRSSWRFRWLGVAAAAVIAGAGWLIVFALIDRYEAVASVFVDTRTPLKPALQGLTVEQDVDSEINFVRQSLLAGPQLQNVAREVGILPSNAIDPRRQEALLADMTRRIRIEMLSASGREEERNTAGSIYRIVYQDRNRARALRVVGILLDAFVNQTLGGKREGSENAQQFLESQISDYEKRLRTAEDRLAAFKSRHIGLMPTEQGGYFAQLQKEQEAVADDQDQARPGAGAPSHPLRAASRRRRCRSRGRPSQARAASRRAIRCPASMPRRHIWMICYSGSRTSIQMSLRRGKRWKI